MLPRDNREMKNGAGLIDSFLKGVSAIAGPVVDTLGPGGRTVVIEPRGSLPKVTKDGASVAKELFLADSYENMALQLVKQASVLSGEIGDGSTTTVLFASEIYSRAAEAVKAGADPVQVKKGVESAVRQFADELGKVSRPAAREDVLKVASISANDPKVGKVVFDAVDGDSQRVVTIDESGTTETVIEKVDGLRIPNGFVSYHFINDPNKYQAVLDDPLIVMVDGKFTSASQLIPVLTVAVKDIGNSSILFLAEDFDESSLTALVRTRLESNMSLVAVKFSAFGSHRAEVMSDIAVLTGGRVFSPSGASFANPLPTDFGRAKKVIVSADSTTVTGGAGSPEAISDRKKELLAQIESAEAQYDKTRLRERFGRIAGGVTVIKAGGSTETEVSELKDRIEDAVAASQAALSGGVLPGGGSATAYVASMLPDAPPGATAGQQVGWKCVTSALTAPIKRILGNAGFTDAESMEAVGFASSEFGVGVDVLTGQKANMTEIGVLDPTKVTVSALRHAGSVAASLIGSSYGITYVKKGNPREDTLS